MVIFPRSHMGIRNVIGLISCTGIANQYVSQLMTNSMCQGKDSVTLMGQLLKCHSSISNLHKINTDTPEQRKAQDEFINIYVVSDDYVEINPPRDKSRDSRLTDRTDTILIYRLRWGSISHYYTTANFSTSRVIDHAAWSFENT